MVDKQQPGLTERAQAALAARRERQAAALRANLRRRKAQQSEPPGLVPQAGVEEAGGPRLPRRGRVR